MPEYRPNVKVEIGTVDVTDFLNGPVTVKRGRDTVYQPTSAGFASFELQETPGLDIRVGRRLRVTVEDSAGAPQPVFSGIVSDFERSTLVASPTDPYIVMRVQAIGPLARLNRRRVFETGRSVERDGARVSDALADGLAEAWEEQPFTITWDSLQPEQVWDTYGGFDASIVDPGVFDLVALPSSDTGYSPLDVVQQSADSAEGILFETPDGRVGYADVNRRFLNARAGYLDIPLNVTVQNRLNVSSELADVTNDVAVVYGSDDLVRRTEPLSISLFGRLFRQLDTLLAATLDAENRADEFVARHASPTLRLQEIGINLRAPEPALLDSLLQLVSCGCTDAVRLVNVPARLGFTQFQGFVEGLEWVLTPTDGEVRLFVSDAVLSITAVRYGLLEPTLRYDQLDPTLEYREARIVEAI
jgi:hypothetical protein